MKTETPVSHLSELGACSDAVAWVKSTKVKSLESAWAKCERGDWMLWYAGKKAGPIGDEKRKRLVLAACGCARLPLPIYEKRYPGDKRVRDCIETAEKWARNEATMEELEVSRRNCSCAAAYAASDAAASSASAAYAAAASSASAAAAYAASSAYAASDAAASDAAAAYAAAASSASAAYAAYNAFAAASAAAASSAGRSKTLKQCTDIVRTFYPELPT